MSVFHLLRCKPYPFYIQRGRKMYKMRVWATLLILLLISGCNSIPPSPPEATPTPLPPTEEPSPVPSPDQPISPQPTVQLSDDEILYEGPTTWGNLFQVRYNKDIWDYAEIDQDLEPVLYHREISGCRFNLSEGARGWPEPDESNLVSLAGYEWSQDVHIAFAGGRYIMYHLTIDSSSFLFAVIHLDPLPPDQSDQCRADAEAILDTFQPR